MSDFNAEKSSGNGFKNGYVALSCVFLWYANDEFHMPNAWHMARMACLDAAFVKNLRASLSTQDQLSSLQCIDIKKMH